MLCPYSIFLCNLSYPGGGPVSQYLFVFMTSLSTALIMVPFLRKWALTIGTVDVPDERKVHHTASTAHRRYRHLHGLPLFPLGLCRSGTREPRSTGRGADHVLYRVVDDLYGISPRRKFFGEIGGCLVTMVVGNLYVTKLGDLFGFGVIALPTWLRPLYRFRRGRGDQRHQPHRRPRWPGRRGIGDRRWLLLYPWLVRRQYTPC